MAARGSVRNPHGEIFRVLPERVPAARTGTQPQLNAAIEQKFVDQPAASGINKYVYIQIFKMTIRMCGSEQSVPGKATSIFFQIGAIRRGSRKTQARRSEMSIGMIILILLVLALVGVIPTWGHSSSWGYGPSGGVGTVLLVVLILVLMGKI